MSNVNVTGVNVHLYYTDISHRKHSLSDTSLNIVRDNSISQLQQRCRYKYPVSLRIHVLFWNNCLKMKKSNWSGRALTYDSLPLWCTMPKQFHDPHTSIMYLKPHNQNLKLIDPSSWTCGRIEFCNMSSEFPLKWARGLYIRNWSEVGRLVGYSGPSVSISLMSLLCHDS